MPVTCGIIMSQNKVLITQRPSHKTLPLKWEFPGGKIEDNETPELCIVRELKEELSIDFLIREKLSTVVHDYGHIIVEMIPFLGITSSSKIILFEHLALEWVLPEQLLSFDLAPADIPIVKEIIHYFGK